MSEMLVSTPLVVSTVEDYDFTFVDGVSMNVTVDISKGDTVKETESRIHIYLTAKPSRNNPNKILPAEDTTLFKRQLVAIQRRTREVTGLTTEQQFEWDKTIEAATSIH